MVWRVIDLRLVLVRFLRVRTPRLIWGCCLGRRKKSCAFYMNLFTVPCLVCAGTVAGSTPKAQEISFCKE